MYGHQVVMSLQVQVKVLSDTLFTQLSKWNLTQWQMTAYTMKKLLQHLQAASLRTGFDNINFSISLFGSHLKNIGEI
jgi:hypothetical protein